MFLTGKKVRRMTTPGLNFYVAHEKRSAVPLGRRGKGLFV